MIKKKGGDKKGHLNYFFGTIASLLLTDQAKGKKKLKRLPQSTRYNLTINKEGSFPKSMPNERLESVLIKTPGFVLPAGGE